MKPPIQAKNAKQPLGLTVAEAECIREYINQGCQKLAARELNISLNTVYTLMKRARIRTGIQSQIHLLVLFDRADPKRIS